VTEVRGLFLRALYERACRAYCRRFQTGERPAYAYSTVDLVGGLIVLRNANDEVARYKYTIATDRLRYVYHKRSVRVNYQYGR